MAFYNNGNQPYPGEWGQPPQAYQQNYYNQQQGYNGNGSYQQHYDAPNGPPDMYGWSRPPQPTFPSKRGQNKPHRGNHNSGFKKNRNPVSQEKKPMDLTGKTPASLLHELYPSLTERYEEVSGGKKAYKCILNVDGVEYSMESTSKKLAKQKAAGVALKTLRPDLNVGSDNPSESFVKGGQITSFFQNPSEEGEPKPTPTPPPPQPRPPRQKHQQPQQGFQQPQQPYQQPRQAYQQQVYQQHPAEVYYPPPQGPPGYQQPYGNYPPVPPPQQQSLKKKKKAPDSQPPSKKLKLSAIDSALSLMDCMRKLCLERAPDGPFNPVFDVMDVSEGDMPNFKKKFKVTLTFPEQGKIYTAEGIGQNAPKDSVVKQSLLDLFSVKSEDLRAIVRRHVMGKKFNLHIIPIFHYVADMCNCTLEFNTDFADEPALGTAPSNFVCKCTLTDKTMDDKTVVAISPPLKSKHAAKNHVALELLKTYFDIDPATMPADKGEVDNGSSPSQRLGVLCAQKFKTGNDLKYEDLGSLPNDGPTLYRAKYTFKTMEFYGTGNSKKNAKNNAAANALVGIFGSNGHPGGQMEHFEVKPEMNCSKFCYGISEYTKREYYQMCNFFRIAPSSELAAFFLINEKMEKRLVSIASSSSRVISSSTVQSSQGSCFVHMDPIVLARRGFVKYLLNELQDPDKPNTIFQKCPDGRYQLNANIRVALYSTFAPDTVYSSNESDQKALCTMGTDGYEAVGDHVQTQEEIKETGIMRVHCTADKMFKWSKIGLQGSLLSTKLQPILLKHVFFGSMAATDDEGLKYAIFERLGSVEDDFSVETHKIEIDVIKSPPHLWTRTSDNVETLELEHGRTITGTPSQYCRSSLYSSFLKLSPSISRETPLKEAKKLAVEYNQAKEELYRELKEAGWGAWQRKPDDSTDFSLLSFDC